MSARGHRLVGVGWAAAMALGLAATAWAGEMIGRFGDGAVRLRPWMQSYNLVLGLLHLSALALLGWGSARLPSGRAQKLALASFTLAALAVGALLLLPVVLGSGPWGPHAVEVRALRFLVFAPSVLRAVGCAALAVALFRSHTASYVIVALLAADAVLVSWAWASTPKAVIACIHPYCASPLGLAPWVLASAVFFAAIGRMTATAEGEG